MSGVLGVLLGLAGRVTSAFNITAGIVAGTARIGYSDGGAGTTSGAGGSITGATLGPFTIAELDDVAAGNQLLRVRGFNADPGQGWLVSVTVNSVNSTGASASYSWNGTSGVATWTWATNTWNLANGSTYNGNSITHN